MVCNSPKTRVELLDRPRFPRTDQDGVPCASRRIFSADFAHRPRLPHGSLIRARSCIGKMATHGSPGSTDSRSQGSNGLDEIFRRTQEFHAQCLRPVFDAPHSAGACGAEIRCSDDADSRDASVDYIDSTAVSRQGFRNLPEQSPSLAHPDSSLRHRTFRVVPLMKRPSMRVARPPAAR